MIHKLTDYSEIQLSLGSNVFALNAKTGPTPLTKHFNVLWTQTTRSPDTATMCRAMLQYAILSNAMTRLVLHKYPAILTSPTLFSLDPPSKRHSHQSPRYMHQHGGRLQEFNQVHKRRGMSTLQQKPKHVKHPFYDRPAIKVSLTLYESGIEDETQSSGATSTRLSEVDREELPKLCLEMLLGFSSKAKIPQNNAAIDALTDIALKHMEAKLDLLMDILKDKITGVERLM
ncbi:hypothetical protein FCULG_00002048 [Fusarium culmorum]|uniref:Uncharacterized protein n=1 Tax=Fusarium culmorum TaxID=5516 RepID=A0A2T4GJZ3_FUSCU|nr:hypothetical protein FCULG_00002048 [Fusarium culmorum]